ncbi:DUF805 domain-containing protein [Kaistia geumhonensis]|uniref:Uncharacterized membrane protein YhaH (DUF805 family) n=1 Tax=Kaistia geumhonensis TaxID=410839 RepID=A0ABU0M5N2_9HYPH|nr:DUF805 domain-containing protein [Kaistia geumhonensis]MCX5478508.1 DUF805 domain-containing protein [Kaistia geumhonensis]MDQ0516274.1 uncharacterized membrane protein YhaH (DUF805 family) [Kaistia geumhonensis]
MDMSTAVRTVFSKYVTFSGRASRPEFWWWVLFTIIVAIVAYVIDYALGWRSEDYGAGPISGLWSLATLLPNLAVTVRRLHDTDRSGWWYFIILIPLIGALILLYWMIKRSDPGTNRFG